MPLPGALGAPRRLILDTAMSTIPLTTTGAELLRQELHRLKTVERPNATTAIAEARTHGDLAECAGTRCSKSATSSLSDGSSHLEMESKCGRESGIDEILATPRKGDRSAVASAMDTSSTLRGVLGD